MKEAAGKWALKADNDLAAAETLLKSGSETTDIICFHAQQCIEK